MIYLITFAAYGHRLHGSEAGSVDRHHNGYGTPTLEVDSARAAGESKRMDQEPYDLDPVRRDVILQAIQEVCAYRGWRVLAAHVRSTHVHTVVDAEVSPERVMSDFKVLRHPPAECNAGGQTESEAVGTTRQHTMAVETTKCLGRH